MLSEKTHNGFSTMIEQRWSTRMAACCLDVILFSFHAIPTDLFPYTCCFFYQTFSSCPHGRCFTLMAQCFSISAWITSMMSITSCFYVYVRPIPEEGQAEYPREGFGYISRQVAVKEPPSYTQCVWYEKSEMEEFFQGDSMWNAGKAMSFLAMLIGFVVMCTVLCT
jgi:hypothetical protein